MSDCIDAVINRPKSCALPDAGSVLGIDVGWSTRCDTTAVCRLSWQNGIFSWKIRRCRAEDPSRENTLNDVAGTDPLLSVAIDGPLRRGFKEIDRYRSAERLLSRGALLKVGKPGQSNSGNGKKLNKQANSWANLVAKRKIHKATHCCPIHEKRIVEAFPTTFLGVMIATPGKVAQRGKRSDRYFRHLVDGQDLDKFLPSLPSNSEWLSPPSEIVDHDDRAAFVCALTALCVAAGQYVAVGDEKDGWIVLPPRWMFAEWAWDALQENLKRKDETGCIRSRSSCLGGGLSEAATQN